MTECKKMATTSAQTEATFRSFACDLPLSTLYSWPTRTYTDAHTRTHFLANIQELNTNFSSTVSKKAHFGMATWQLGELKNPTNPLAGIFGISTPLWQQLADIDTDTFVI